MTQAGPRVPFVDLRIQYRAIGVRIRAELAEVMESCDFIGSPKIAAFEERFAAYCGVGHAVALSSGTAAVHLALAAAGVGPGDEVITVSHTYAATAEGICHCGAKPVFVDVDEATCNMDPALVTAAITPRTKAVLPVHLYGQTADMAPLAALAAERGLLLIEDACQAHGAEYIGRRAGSLGHAAAFSFYPGKNLGAYGEGGAVTTSSPEIADRARLLRNHGCRVKYYHELVGYNYRINAFQAAVLGVKLDYLDEWNEARRRHAARYSGLLAGARVVTPVEAPGRKHVYHLYVIRCTDRDGLAAALAQAGVATVIHYPVPVHLLQAFAHLGYARGSLPVTEQLAGQILSLPMFPELTEEQVRHVASAVRSFAG